MKIYASDAIANVQKRFNNQYPELKLTFFLKTHEVSKSSSPREFIKDEHLRIVQLYSLAMDTDIDTSENITVAALEAAFESLGLHVQVLRKSGNIWLQTSATDHWTLGKQQYVAKAEGNIANWSDAYDV